MKSSTFALISLYFFFQYRLSEDTIQNMALRRVASRYLVELVLDRGQAFSRLQSAASSRTVSVAPATPDTNTNTDTRTMRHQAIKLKPIVTPI